MLFDFVDICIYKLLFECLTSFKKVYLEKIKYYQINSLSYHIRMIDVLIYHIHIYMDHII